jgi:hypothetical protein
VNFCSASANSKYRRFGYASWHKENHRLNELEKANSGTIIFVLEADTTGSGNVPAMLNHLVQVC